MEISNEQVCSAITRFIRKEVKKRDARVVVLRISWRNRFGVDCVAGNQSIRT